jgi:hypothetical protein
MRLAAFRMSDKTCASCEFWGGQPREVESYSRILLVPDPMVKIYSGTKGKCLLEGSPEAGQETEGFASCDAWQCWHELEHSEDTRAVASRSEAGGFFFFNWNKSSGAAAMSIDLLSAIAPNNSTCPGHFRNAFFEVCFGGIGNNPEMDQKIFDQVQNVTPCLRPRISDAETRLLEGSTDQLGFVGHLLAVWSDSAGALPFIHQSLSDSPNNGYLGWIPLVGVNTIEQFHAVGRELELAFDTCVNVGTYLSTRPWRSFPEGTLERLGFTKSEE